MATGRRAAAAISSEGLVGIDLKISGVVRDRSDDADELVEARDVRIAAREADQLEKQYVAPS